MYIISQVEAGRTRTHPLETSINYLVIVDVVVRQNESETDVSVNCAGRFMPASIKAHRDNERNARCRYAFYYTRA